MPEALIIGGATALVLMSWFAPLGAGAFVIAGTTAYYALMDLLDIPTSGEISGAVFAITGSVSLVRLMLRRDALRVHPLFAILFIVFVVIWQVRWVIDPPGPQVVDAYAQFAERAQIFMLFFAVVPFFIGYCVRNEEQFGRLRKWLAGWGSLSLLIVLGYWVAGAGEAGMSGRWQPVRSLTGIVMALEIGIGTVAAVGLAIETRRRRWHVLALLSALSAVIVVLQIGQRGPFAFLVATCGALVLFGPGARIRRSLQVTIVVAVVGASVFGLPGAAELASESRASRLELYQAANNQERLELIVGAGAFFMEAPFFGWGGSLVGRPVGMSWWQYSHVFVLDPVIETGILGTVPFWALYIFLLTRVRRGWRSGSRLLLPLLALFAYTALQGLVAGHVSQRKHLWMMTGVLAAATAWTRREAFSSRSYAGRDAADLPRLPTKAAGAPHGGRANEETYDS